MVDETVRLGFDMIQEIQIRSVRISIQRPQFPRYPPQSTPTFLAIGVLRRRTDEISGEGRQWNSYAAMVLARFRRRKAPRQRKVRQSLSSKRSQGSFSFRFILCLILIEIFYNFASRRILRPQVLCFCMIRFLFECILFLSTQ